MSLPTDPMAALATAVALVVAAVFLIAILGMRLARRYPSDIRIICYFFSLTVVLTVVVAMWANAIGAMDGEGAFHGQAGSVLNQLLRALLDVSASLKILGALAAVVVLPQLASYLLGGLFGCGSAPILVGRTLVFIVWSFAKTLIVASGMLVAVAGYGYFAEWKSWSAGNAMSIVMTGALLAAMTFVVLYLYRFEVGDARPGAMSDRSPAGAGLVTAHAWMTRNVGDSSERGRAPTAPPPQK